MPTPKDLSGFWRCISLAGGVNVSLEDVARADEKLENRFGVWADEWFDEVFAERHVDPTDEKWSDWKQRGLVMAHEVRRIVPDEYTLFYTPFKDEFTRLRVARNSAIP